MATEKLIGSIPLPDRDYSCASAFCDDPACNTHGAKDSDDDLLYWTRHDVLAHVRIDTEADDPFVAVMAEKLARDFNPALNPDTWFVLDRDSNEVIGRVVFTPVYGRGKAALNPDNVCLVLGSKMLDSTADSHPF